MSPPRSTTWDPPDHTRRGKHTVLREYLKAWFPIMAFPNRRLVFVDGFAGPGEYPGGEPGSPVIAMETYRRGYPAFAKKFAGGEMVFLFVEREPDRVAHLREVVEKTRSNPLPGHVRIEVEAADFESAMRAVLGSLKPGMDLAPAFVMVDPFGVKGFPMELLGRLLQRGKVELYISFMYEWIDRFKSTDEFGPLLTPLYGTDEWRKALDLKGDAKRDFLLGLYERQLRAVGAKHVLRFDLYRNGRNVYALFFATKHPKGADVMKGAMWKVAPFGDFAFHGRRDAQRTLGMLEPDLTPLRDAILAEFGVRGWITIEDVEEFVSSDKTDFHTGQLRKPVLIPMERQGRIEVDPKSRKAKWGFPAGTTFRFR